MVLESRRARLRASLLAAATRLSLALSVSLVPTPASSQTLIGKFVKDPVRPAPGYYFVSFVRDTRQEDLEPLAHALADAHDGVIVVIYPRGFQASMSEEAAIELSHDPRVEIVADYPIEEPEVPPSKLIEAQLPGSGEYTVWLSYSPHLFDDARVREIARALTTEYGGAVLRARASSIGRPHFSLKAAVETAREMAGDARVHYLAEMDHMSTTHGPLEIPPAPHPSPARP